MFYGYQDSLTLYLVSDVLNDLESLATELALLEGGMVHADFLGFIEMKNEPWRGFPYPPLAIEFSAETHLTRFKEARGVELVGIGPFYKQAGEMMDKAAFDEAEAAAQNDTRTLAEIHGLDKFDPWDKRTDEQKQRDSIINKNFDKNKEQGGVTGESFDPNFKRDAPENPMRITGGDIQVDDEGRIIGGHVFAQKGGGPDIENESDHEAAPIIDDPETAGDYENVAIPPDDHAYLFHKVEIIGEKLETVNAELARAGADITKTYERRNHPDGCWFVTLTPSHAKRLADILDNEGYHLRTYVVNVYGEQILEDGIDGVTVLTKDHEVEMPMRPWNARAVEFFAMPEDERKEYWKKSVRPQEFYLVGKDYGQPTGIIITITPRSYFDEHEEPWDGPLDIGHMFPADIKEVGNGVYKTNSRDWTRLSFELYQGGFQDGFLTLQLYLNEQKLGQKQ